MDLLQRSYLSNICRVRNEWEAFQLAVAYVRLEKNVDFAIGILDSTCDRQLTVIAQQLIELLQFLLSYLQKHKEIQYI